MKFMCVQFAGTKCWWAITEECHKRGSDSKDKDSEFTADTASVTESVEAATTGEACNSCLNFGTGLEWMTPSLL